MHQQHNRIITDGYLKIAVSVITQAVSDYKRFTPSCKVHTKNGYTDVYKNYRDAQRFLFYKKPHTQTGYLEIYLSSYNLELNPEYIRRKAKNGKADN
jgi:hypothetical protein